MAQRVKIEVIDDIDGTTADQQIEFSLDGVTYALDLSTANAEKLRAEFAPWTSHARRTGKRRITKNHAGGDRNQARTIREWARQQGLHVSDRGRVSGEIREAYAKAQAQ